mmetsp:Transcript_146793/g.256087  ORF Transcript_146793/g.256087 Transcript_146793/m.256087 type:complete len:156 (-) Transcript_146793:116-583(-)
MMAVAWVLRLATLFSALQALAANEVDIAETRWAWTGCNEKDLCECKLHGQVAGVKGTDIAETCQKNGYAIPKLEEMKRLYTAVKDDMHAFQCDTLKLNAFCFSQNGCLNEANKVLCNKMKGKTCDVDCNGSPASVAISWLAPLLLIVTILARDYH